VKPAAASAAANDSSRLRSGGADAITAGMSAQA
jgi:hypothetical protein